MPKILETQISSTEEQKQQKLVVKSSKKSRRKWTAQQNQIYLEFIVKNKSTLQHQTKGPKKFIFNKMADAIKTRNSRNCKSHHQKMLQNYNSIDNIVMVYHQNGKIQNFLKSEKKRQNQLYPILNHSKQLKNKLDNLEVSYTQNIQNYIDEIGCYLNNSSIIYAQDLLYGEEYDMEQQECI